MVPKHSLLKYFRLTFTRHKSSKFEGSGPPLSRLERDGRLFELRAFTSPTATDLNNIQCSLFKDCVKKTLTMAGCL